MLKEEMKRVIDTIDAKVVEAMKNFTPPAPETPKPVEVDIDGIVKLVLDKIQLSSAPAVAAEIPKKGKEK